MTHRTALWTTPAAIVVTALSASAELSVEAQITARQVEVGERFQFEITAMTDDGSVTTPSLSVPRGLRASGPSIGSRTQVQLTFGRMVKQNGISATWTFEASKPGSYVIGPVTVTDGKQTKATGSATVEVVPSGTLNRRPARRRGPFGGSPFDPFGNSPFGNSPFGNSPFDDLFQRNAAPEAPEEYRIDSAPDGTAFVRAVVTPRDAVVGQQVTLSVYAYGGSGPFNEASSTEPSATDFLSYPKQERAPRLRFYQVPIGERLWHAVKLRETALFPLHAGELTLGAMKVGFAGGRYSESSMDAVVRHSDALTVHVTEPPLDKRPPGYVLGNVGRYKLSASAEPRTARAGDSISVVAKLEGVGNLPRELQLPERNGVEWLTPNVQEALGFDDHGRYGGSRTFTYVVRLTEAGELDLGKIDLPYYDPESKRYRVAHADLGQVTVAPGVAAPASSGNAGASAAAGDADDLRNPLERLASSVGVRKDVPRLGPASSVKPLTERPFYWIMLVGGPLSVVSVGASMSVARRLRRHWMERRSSAAARANAELRDAKIAARNAKPGDAARHLERGLFLALEERAGIKARGVLRAELARELEKHGLDTRLASDVCHALDRIEALRFGGFADADAVTSEVEGVVAQVGFTRGKAGAAGGST